MPTITIESESYEATPEQVEKIREMFIQPAWKFGYSCFNTASDGSQIEGRYNGCDTDMARILFGNAWRTSEQERKMAARIQAHLQLAQIALEIGESKEWEELYTYGFERPTNEFKAFNITDGIRHQAHEFPTREKCDLFIKRGQKWLEVLHPIIKK